MGETTEQVKQPPNPTGKGGFGDHPENRNDGGRLPNPLKEYSRAKFDSMTDKQKDNYLAKVAPIDRWKMSEGNPSNDTDITSGGEPIPFMTLDELRKNNSNNKDSEPEQKD